MATNGPGRAAALRSAEAALARRAKAFKEREAGLRSTLLEYYHMRDRAERARDDGRAKAERIRKEADARIAAILEQAQTTAEGFDRQADSVVARLLAAGESRAQVADLTGLSASQVRDTQRTEAQPSGT